MKNKCAYVICGEQGVGPDLFPSSALGRDLVFAESDEFLLCDFSVLLERDLLCLRPSNTKGVSHMTAQDH